MANEIVTYVSKLRSDSRFLMYSTLIGGNMPTPSLTQRLAVDAQGLRMLSWSQDYPNLSTF